MIAMPRPKIVTSHNDWQPWPEFDWSAWRDGDEESGVRGYGPTKEAAIADLISKEEEDT